MSTPVTQIVMVGPRGVGKTSLLSAMYGELKEELKKIQCCFVMEAGPTQRAINERLKELKRVAQGSGVKIQTGEGIDPGQLEERYTFHLDVGGGGEPEATLEFIDLPGGWYTAEGDYQRADQILASSHVSFLAVDATALMESPMKANQDLGKYHEDINAPDYIRDAYERVSFEDSHLVILTLIRAESYIKKGNLSTLIRKTQQAYWELAEVLHRKDVPLMGCYVETVGSLYFNAFEEKDGSVSSKFIRDPRKGYSPSRCAVPLRIAVGKAMLKVIEDAIREMDKNDTIGRRVAEWIGIPTDLRKALAKLRWLEEVFEKLLSGIEEDDYFEIKP